MTKKQAMLGGVSIFIAGVLLGGSGSDNATSTPAATHVNTPATTKAATLPPVVKSASEPVLDFASEPKPESEPEPEPVQRSVPVTKQTPAPASKPVVVDVQSASGCHPGYSGCLMMNTGDYDCAGGSGNGPNYIGTVQVYGSDPFDLDRDGNGWGCE